MPHHVWGVFIEKVGRGAEKWPCPGKMMRRRWWWWWWWWTVCGGDGGRLCRSVQDRTRCNRNVPDELWHRGVARAKSRQSWC